LEEVVILEITFLWELVQDLELAERDQVRFELVVGCLHVLQELAIRHLWLVIEHGEDHHLKSADCDLVSLCSLVANSSPKFCTALVELPVELPSGELGEIVLLEHCHALLDLLWELLDLHRLGLLLAIHVVVGLWESTLVWPVTSRKYFTVKVNRNHLVTR